MQHFNATTFLHATFWRGNFIAVVSSRSFHRGHFDVKYFGRMRHFDMGHFFTRHFDAFISTQSYRRCHFDVQYLGASDIATWVISIQRHIFAWYINAVILTRNIWTHVTFRRLDFIIIIFLHLKCPEFYRKNAEFTNIEIITYEFWKKKIYIKITDFQWRFYWPV